MKMIEITCSWCGKVGEKPAKEINRQIKNGATNFFCDKKCSCSYGNSLRDDLVVELSKTCPVCQTPFKTQSGKLEKDHCSRACASRGSVTEVRREAGRRVGNLYHSINAEQVARLLMKKREAAKYQKLAAYLQGRGLRHEFEKAIESYVFDLVIEDEMIIFEFDGPEHTSRRQKETDKLKDEVARTNGYRMIREGVNPNQVIDHLLIDKHLKPAMRSIMDGGG
jgi:very-short-patch-repair endonuclease